MRTPWAVFSGGWAGGVLLAGLALTASSCGGGGDSTVILPAIGMSSGGSAGSGEMTRPTAPAAPPRWCRRTRASPRGPQQLLLLHTNDLHSHLMGQGPGRDYTPATTGDDNTRGGMARLATAIGGARAQATAAGRQVLLLDAGDFMMGTLFELLATLEVPELRLMQALGYDATTLGNHELDWTPLGLAAILQAAATKQVTLPILSSNMSFSATDAGDDALQALVAATGALRPKLVKTVGAIKVGMFGLLGANAVQVTPRARPLSFEAIDVAAARMVAELRNVDQVDPGRAERVPRAAGTDRRLTSLNETLHLRGRAVVGVPTLLGCAAGAVVGVQSPEGGLSCACRARRVSKSERRSSGTVSPSACPFRKSAGSGRLPYPR